MSWNKPDPFYFHNAEGLTVNERFDRAVDMLSIFNKNANEETLHLYQPKSGAKEEELNALEAELGLALPTEHKKLLRRWRFFRFYDGYFDSGRFLGPASKKPNLPRPWLIGNKLVLGQASSVSNCSFLAVDTYDINGPVQFIERWDGEHGVDAPNERTYDIHEFAPSVSLAFYRIAVEKLDKIEKSRLSGEEIKRRDDGTIEFGIRSKDIETPQYFCPTVAGYTQKEVRKNLVSANTVVIPDESIHIVFDYPLSQEVILEFKNKGGFSRLDLFRCIHEGYSRIYAEEEAESGDPGNVPGLMNRERSEGPHGIWGHRMSELFLEVLVYSPAEKTLTMYIGS